MTLPKGAVPKMDQNVIQKTPFVLFQAHADDYYQISKKNNLPSKKMNPENNLLARAFFHPKNIDLIQKKIIGEIFQQTKGKHLIENQNEENLKKIMKYIFGQHENDSIDVDKYGQIGQNQNIELIIKNIRNKISYLDKLVVNEVCPAILSELEAYDAYLERAFGKIQLLDLPKNVSNAGMKSLPSVSKRFDTDF